MARMKNMVVSAAVAVKLAMNLFKLKDKAKENADGDAKEKADEGENADGDAKGKADEGENADEDAKKDTGENAGV